MDAKQQQEGSGGSTRPRDIAREEAGAGAGKRLSGGGQGWHPEADMPRKDAGDAAPPSQGQEGGKL
jgi:hypothetical protein